VNISFKGLIPLLNKADQAVYFFVEFGIFTAQFLNFPDAVDDRGVVFSTEFLSDFRK
jgi:hypothetical protein